MKVVFKFSLLNKRNIILCGLMLSLIPYHSYASIHKVKKQSYGCTERVKRLFIYSLLASTAIIPTNSTDTQTMRTCRPCDESMMPTKHRFKVIEQDILNKDVFLNDNAVCLNGEDGHSAFKSDRWCEQYSAELQVMLEGLHYCKCPGSSGLLKSVENLLGRLKTRYFINGKGLSDQVAEVQTNKYIQWLKDNAGYIYKKMLA